MKIWNQLVNGVGRKWWKKKTTLSDEFVCFQIGIKDFKLEVFYYFIILVINHLFLKKTMLLQRESFPTMFYINNSSPMLVTKSVFKLILFCFEKLPNVYLPFKRSLHVYILEKLLYLIKCLFIFYCFYFWYLQQNDQQHKLKGSGYVSTFFPRTKYHAWLNLIGLSTQINCHYRGTMQPTPGAGTG